MGVDAIEHLSEGQLSALRVMGDGRAYRMDQFYEEERRKARAQTENRTGGKRKRKG